MVSLRGQKRLGLHPDWSLLGVLFKISDKHPHPCHMRATSIQVVIDNNKLTPMGPDANITNKSLLRSADIILLFFSLLNLHKKT